MYYTLPHKQIIVKNHRMHCVWRYFSQNKQTFGGWCVCFFFVLFRLPVPVFCGQYSVGLYFVQYDK